VTDAERCALTEALRHRRRRTARRTWLLFAVGLGAATWAALVMFPGDGHTTPPLIAGLGLAFGAVLALFTIVFAPMATASVNRFEQELAAVRDETADDGRAPAPPGLLEIAWRPEGYAAVSWNGAPAGALAGPGLAGLEWHDPPPPENPGWERTVVRGFVPYLRLVADGRRYLLGEMSLLVDGYGRGWPLPRARAVRTGEDVRVELPGELTAVGAMAVLDSMAFLQNLADAAAAQAGSDIGG
jgi:hypothetical protein